MEEIGQKINYTVRKSARARRMRISVSCDGKVVATIPAKLGSSNLEAGRPSKILDDFVREKWDWVKKVLDKFALLPEWQKKRYTKKDYLNNKEATRKLVLGRLEYFNQFYGFRWGRIAIRDQKSRWGSCSRRGNLNFNYKLVFLPPELQDYIVVHELCHLGELNHSKRFWALVGKTLPEYNKLRKQLRRK